MPIKIKQLIARLIQWKPTAVLMRLAIRIIVPRHQMGVLFIPIDPQGRILLLNHVFHPNLSWSPPGGWLDRKENPVTCATRELFEETGLVPTTIGPIVNLTTVHPPHHLAAAYAGYVTPQPLKLSYEILEGNWFFPNELPPLYPFVKQSIDAALIWHASNLKD